MLFLKFKKIGIRCQVDFFEAILASLAIKVRTDLFQDKLLG
jgi:hypothetical protein